LTTPKLGTEHNLVADLDPAAAEYLIPNLVGYHNGLTYYVVNILFSKYQQAYTDAGYYEGFDADYDAGGQAAVACQAVVEPAPEDPNRAAWDAAGGDKAQYCRATGVVVDPGTAGWTAGFNDTWNNTPGASKPNLPDLGHYVSLNAINLETGEIAWTFQIKEAFEMNYSLINTSAASSASPVISENGNVAFLVEETDRLGGGLPQNRVVVVNGADGTLMGSNLMESDSLTMPSNLFYIQDSVVVYFDLNVFFYRESDMQNSYFQKKVSMTQDGERGTMVVGKQYIRTNDGYISITDGSPAPFGQDVSDNVGYGVFPGVSTEPLFRFVQASDETLSFQRWDAETNTALWPNTIPALSYASISAAPC
jgi:hypothetical protein